MRFLLALPLLLVGCSASKEPPVFSLITIVVHAPELKSVSAIPPQPEPAATTQPGDELGDEPFWRP